MSEKVRAAIVGCGSVGSLYDENRESLDPRSHAGAYSRHARTRLVAGVDRDLARRNGFAEMWKVPVYSDFKEMLLNEKPDIVSVCTWPDSHAEICIKAAEAGVRAIFCEKPLADSLIDGRNIVRMCERHQVVLAVNHIRRWDKAHQEIAKFLGRGELGRLEHATVHYVRGIANSGSHIADMLRFFFGEVASVRAFNRTKDSRKDPILDGYIGMQSGVSCALVGCHSDSYGLFDVDIIGTKGRLRLEDYGYRIRLWRSGSNPEIPDRQILVETAHPFPPSMHGYMLAAVNNLVDCLTEGDQPLNTGRDGLAALEVITALRQSASADGEKVQLPLV